MTHFLDDDFVWSWSSACSEQYKRVVELTSVVHVNVADRPLRPLEPHSTCPAHESINDTTATLKPSSPSTVGRPPSVLSGSSDSNNDSCVSRHSSDEAWENVYIHLVFFNRKEVVLEHPSSILLSPGAFCFPSYLVRGLCFYIWQVVPINIHYRVSM